MITIKELANERFTQIWFYCKENKINERLVTGHRIAETGNWELTIKGREVQTRLLPSTTYILINDKYLLYLNNNEYTEIITRG